MSKYKSPLNGNELWISQTYHITGGNKAIDFGNAPAGSPVYAVASGTVGTVSPTQGSYLTIKVDNSPLTLFYVHIYNFTVKAGQKVKTGDKIGEIAPKSLNGGFSPHLHLGLQTGKNIMDYFDRGIIFRTAYKDIEKVWFKGDSLNWSLFKDLSYESGTTMSFKKGDVIIFTAKQNKRGGAGTGFTDIGAYEKGDMAIIKDNPRTSQNSLFYGKGSDKKTNDDYVWFDTTPVKGGASSWVADMGKFRIATPEEINPTPTPEPPVPIPTPTPEPTNWEERYNEELEKNKGLVEDVRALEKEVKRLELEIEQEEIEYRELRVECDGLEEKNKMLEEERLLLQEKQDGELKDYRRWSWLVNVLNSVFPRK